MGQIRIADLPSTNQIDGDSYVIIEKPEVGAGTYKAKVNQLQRALIVYANVTRTDDTVTIYLKDITGQSSESIVIPHASVTKSGRRIDINMSDEDGSTSAFLFDPVARVIDNGDNTITLQLSDSSGTTQSTIIKSVQVDPHPTQGSTNFVTSGEIYSIVQSLTQQITNLQTRIATLENQVQSMQSEMGRTISVQPGNTV